HGVGLAGRDHVVVGLGLLQHAPHGVHVVAGEAPVAARLEVPEAELALEAELHARGAVAHLPRDELAAAAGGVVHDETTYSRKERLLRPVVPVENEGGHLLVPGGGVELAPEPRGDLGNPSEREVLDRALAIEAGPPVPFPRAPEEQTRPQLGDPGAKGAAIVG